MIKRFKCITVGIIIGAILTSGFVFAKQISETAELYYNNIKIFIDGAEIVPKDGVGNIAEPFTVNGTTYLPVRAISNALGKDVEWDGTTQSIYIGKKNQTKPDNYLNKIQYNDYKEADGTDDFSVINGTITDFNNNTYTNGLLFYEYWTRELENDSDKSDILIAYPLNSQYKLLKGNIVLPKELKTESWGELKNLEANPVDVWFYGDGKLLYKATNVTSSMPFKLDIDVTGVNQLIIKLKWESCSKNCYASLTDLALYK